MVYFADEDYSLTTFAIVNGGLYYLLQERVWYAEGEEEAELLRYMDMCCANFETALVNLPLLMPARKESVEVLVLGVSQALSRVVTRCSGADLVPLVHVCHRGLQVHAGLEVQHNCRDFVSDPWLPSPTPAASGSSGSLL
jgi:hypothetical protein